MGTSICQQKVAMCSKNLKEKKSTIVQIVVQNNLDYAKGTWDREPEKYAEDLVAKP